MTISEKIFALLEQKELSQKEFSEKTEISQSTISDWKRKRTNPSSDKILKICEVLQVSPYELLAEDDSVCHETAADHNIVLNNDEIILLENLFHQTQIWPSLLLLQNVHRDSIL